MPGIYGTATLTTGNPYVGGLVQLQFGATKAAHIFWETRTP